MANTIHPQAYIDTNLSREHARELIEGSGISPEVIQARGYRTAKTKTEVKHKNFSDKQAVSGGLLIPAWNVYGEIDTWQVKLDDPRPGIKYESPAKSRGTIDIHPFARDKINDPSIPIYISEGLKKLDSILSHAPGVCVIGLAGVWAWRFTNVVGGKTAHPDLEKIAWNERIVNLVFDSDVVIKPEVKLALTRLGNLLTHRGAIVRYAFLEGATPTEKVGIDDWLVKGNKLENLPTFTDPLEIEPTYEFTDVGNAQMFSDKVGDKFKYTKEAGWLSFTGTQYEVDSEILARAAAEEVTESIPRDSSWYYESHNSTRLTNLLREAQRKCFADLADFDKDPHELATPSGVVDLRTGEIRETTSEDLVTKQTGVGVDFNKEPTEFLKFIRETFLDDEDLVNYFLHSIGSSLFGFTADQLFYLWLGSGANGKSVCLELIAKVLGGGDTGYAGSMPPGLLIKKRHEPHPTELADLRSKRFAYTSENSSEGAFDESKLRRLTGGDTIKARYMNKNFFEFEPTFNIFIASNSTPQLAEGGHAFWRRIRIIPFENKVPLAKRIAGLSTSLVEKEGPAILSLFIRYAVSYYKNGMPAIPEKVKIATDEYKAEEDTSESFLSEQCEFSPDRAHDDFFKISVAQLRQAYETWCAAESKQMHSSQVFNMRVKNRGGRKVRFGAGGRGGKGWAGVRLANNITESDDSEETESVPLLEIVSRQCPASVPLLENEKRLLTCDSVPSVPLFSQKQKDKNKNGVPVPHTFSPASSIEKTKSGTLGTLSQVDGGVVENESGTLGTLKLGHSPEHPVFTPQVNVEGSKSDDVTESDEKPPVKDGKPSRLDWDQGIVNRAIEGYRVGWLSKYITPKTPTPCSTCGEGRVYGGYSGDRFVCPACYPDEVNPS